MACRSSKTQRQNNGDLFNEDTNVRRKLLTGIQISKDTDGIEGNVQIAFGKTKRKRCEKVADAPPPVDEKPEPKEEE